MTSWEEGPVSRERSLWGGEEWRTEGDAEADARVSGFLPGPWGLHWERGRPTACFLQHMWPVAGRGPENALPCWWVKVTLRPDRDGKSCDGGHPTWPGPRIPEPIGPSKTPKVSLATYEKLWPGASCPFEGEVLFAISFVSHLIKIRGPWI